MLNKIKEILNTFTYVTTSVVLGSAIFIKIFWGDPILSVDILWQILSVPFLCCMGNYFYSQKVLSKRQLIVHTVLHYIYINIVVIGSGIYFRWFDWKRIDMIGSMILMIAIIFGAIWIINRERDKKLAEKLNKKLEEYLAKREDI
jgi:hypothetical protein